MITDMKEENKKGNVLISRFMGWIFKPKHIDNQYPSFVKYDKQGEEIDWFSGGDSWNVSDEWDIPYHCDWNEIMPVVEKIETMGYKFEIVEAIAYLCPNDDSKEEETPSMGRDGKNKIDAAYLLVLDFIKWYNQQPK